jgi:hypothetical protein
MIRLFDSVPGSGRPDTMLVHRALTTVENTSGELARKQRMILYFPVRSNIFTHRHRSHRGGRVRGRRRAGRPPGRRMAGPGLGRGRGVRVSRAPGRSGRRPAGRAAAFAFFSRRDNYRWSRIAGAPAVGGAR